MQNNNHLILLMDFVSLGVRQGPAEMACLCSAVFGTSTGDSGVAKMSQTSERQNMCDQRIHCQSDFSLNVSGSLAGIVTTQSLPNMAVTRTLYFLHGDLLVDGVTSPPRFKESVSGMKISPLNERNVKEFMIAVCLNCHRVG